MSQYMYTIKDRTYKIKYIFIYIYLKNKNELQLKISTLSAELKEAIQGAYLVATNGLCFKHSVLNFGINSLSSAACLVM